MDEFDKKINYGQLNQSGGRIVKVNNEIILLLKLPIMANCSK